MRSATIVMTMPAVAVISTPHNSRSVAKVWPALSSQFVLMLLASSITSFISVQELSGTAAVIESRSFRSIESYLVATGLYLVLALGLKAILWGIGRLAFPRVSGLARVQTKGEAA